MFKIEFEVRINLPQFKHVVECFCGEKIYGNSVQRAVQNYIEHLDEVHRINCGVLYFKRSPKPTYMYFSENHYLIRNEKNLKKYVRINGF